MKLIKKKLPEAILLIMFPLTKIDVKKKMKGGDSVYASMCAWENYLKKTTQNKNSNLLVKSTYWRSIPVLCIKGNVNEKKVYYVCGNKFSGYVKRRYNFNILTLSLIISLKKVLSRRNSNS